MQKNEIQLGYKIDLSVIIISLSTDKYHTKDNLEVTLKSMAPAVRNVKHEVILVDNSTIDDGTLKMTKEYFSDVIYLKRKEVHGFGDNNNFGLKQATGKYVLFLNNDMEVIDSKIFEEMVDWMDKNESVAVVSSALLNSDKKTLQRSGGYFPNLARVFAWMFFVDDLPFLNTFIKSYHPAINYFKNSHNQDWVTGAFYLVRKTVLDEVGAFDEDYDAYVEETDLSYRIKEQDWDIWYMPKWKIVHFGGQSYGNENSLIFELRNLKLFYKKHYSKWQLPILNIIIKLGCFLRIVIFGLINPKLSKIYAKAFKSV